MPHYGVFEAHPGDMQAFTLGVEQCFDLDLHRFTTKFILGSISVFNSRIWIQGR
jgi:hypothetical protein